jgi:hypothetical protein
MLLHFRRLAALLVLAALFALLCACGRSSSSKGPTPAASGTPDPDFLAAANRAVDAVMPRLADLPAGWTAAPHDPNALQGFTGDCAPLNADDPVAGSALGKTSDDFSGPGYSLVTYVDVFKNAGQAKDSLGTLTDLVKHCGDQLKTVFGGNLAGFSALSDIEVTFGDLKTARFGDQSPACRVAYTFTRAGSPSSGATDIILVRTGAMIATVVATSDGKDSSIVVGLTRTLAGRMGFANAVVPTPVPARSAVPTLTDQDFHAAANAAADSVLLKLTDLPPGWMASPHVSDSSSDTDLTGECAPLNGDNVETLSSLGKSSDDFVGAVANQASAGVDVFRSASDAKRELDTLANLVHRCQDQLVKMLTTGTQDAIGDSVADVQVSFVELPLPALADDAEVFRLPVSVSGRGRRFTIVLDMVFIRKGAIVTALITTTDDTTSPLTGNLARVIAGRMTSANATLPQ